MTPSHKKSGVAFWATVVVVVLAIYQLGFGPAFCVAKTLGYPRRMVNLLEMAPDALWWFAKRGPEPAASIADHYYHRYLDWWQE
jgi:hypothetical protein